MSERTKNPSLRFLGELLAVNLASLALGATFDSVQTPTMIKGIACAAVVSKRYWVSPFVATVIQSTAIGLAGFVDRSARVVGSKEGDLWFALAFSLGVLGYTCYRKEVSAGGMVATVEKDD